MKNAMSVLRIIIICFKSVMGFWATWSSGRCPCPWQGGWNQM